MGKWTAIVLIAVAIAFGSGAVAYNWSVAQVGVACVNAGNEFRQGQCVWKSNE